MTSGFDAIKKTAIGRSRDESGDWSEPKEFQYLSQPHEATSKWTSSIRSVRKKNWLKILISWVKRVLAKPRYTLLADEGHTFRLDTVTGETWYCYTQREELFAIAQGAPKWVKVRESKLNKPQH